ncbi:polysaccharide pyruvyl transferase family protein [Cupriavidus metallidurans]|uniref:polysaccharide pyruvyl transferase family protein n=1 Tax=Cupriavidus metallidurans TaxID=119219 RepID=UPI001CCD0BAA|nr:polysaccharide pyruvyl transferase family protein [Cupriavidus metallidurans]UBM09146.1 polysaccharide pyruvyl transferase family protein [Cupriavidus metallidurans]
MKPMRLQRRLAARIGAREWLRAACVELAGREPSTADFEACIRALRVDGDPAAALRGLAKEDAHWHHLLQQRAPEVVAAVYRALLWREPDAAGQQAYAKLLAEKGDIGVLITDIGGSSEHIEGVFRSRLPAAKAMLTEALELDDGELLQSEGSQSWDDFMQRLCDLSREGSVWRAQVRAHRVELVHGVFQALLGRTADAGALEAYSQQLGRTGDIARFVSQVSRSPEHLEFRLRDERKRPGMEALTRIGCDADLIARTYLRFSGREPEACEVANCLADSSAVGTTLRAYFGPPARGRGIRVLIFGAYGNGNLGDTYQAMAVREHLVAAWDISPDAVWACSLLKSADYAFPADRKLASEAILDPIVVNDFDVVVIGGGGLLAHPHDPLRDLSAWARQIHAPILLLAVGAGANAATDHAELLARAWLVAGRDSASISALRKARPDTIHMLDPILSMPDVDAMSALDAPVEVPSGPVDVLWILKYPANAADDAFLTWIASYIAERGHERHVVLAMEPALDKSLSELFSHVPVVLARSLTEQMTRIRSASRVVTMRYHGAIFAAHGGRYFHAFSQGKIRALTDMYPLLGDYVESTEALGNALATPVVKADNRAFFVERAMQFRNVLRDEQALGATSATLLAEHGEGA